jgi:hypothetical protein
MAESVAYVVCAHVGLDTGARSFPYVATWSQNAAVLKAAMARIQQVSNRIIHLVDPATSTSSADLPSNLT